MTTALSNTGLAVEEAVEEACLRHDEFGVVPVGAPAEKDTHEGGHPDDARVRMQERTHVDDRRLVGLEALDGLCK